MAQISSNEKKMGVQIARRKQRARLSTQSRFSLSLVFGPWSRRIRSQARSSNNSSYASPRLVSYFSKVFKQASTQTVTELHDGKDERRRTLLHLPLSLRRNH